MSVLLILSKESWAAFRLVQHLDPALGRTPSWTWQIAFTVGAKQGNAILKLFFDWDKRMQIVCQDDCLCYPQVSSTVHLTFTTMCIYVYVAWEPLKLIFCGKKKKRCTIL